jgi:hypothetical protein
MPWWKWCGYRLDEKCLQNTDIRGGGLVERQLSAGPRALARAAYPDVWGSRCDMVVNNNLADWLRGTIGKGSP